MDVARGLSVSLADAERLKTLYGACIASPSDDRETIAVHRVGDDMDHPSHISEVGTRAHHPPARRGDPRTRARPAQDGRARRRTPGRRLVLTGRRLPADRAARTRAHDRFETGADRSPARRRGPAGIGQEPGFRGGGRPDGLSAGGGDRAFRAGAVGGSARRGRRRLCRAGRAVVEAEFLR